MLERSRNASWARGPSSRPASASMRAIVDDRVCIARSSHGQSRLIRASLSMIDIISSRPDAREPRHRRALHLHPHRRQHRRRAARLRPRARARRRRPDPARASDPDRALRGRRRPHALPRRPAHPPRRPRRRRRGRARHRHSFANAGDEEARLRVEVRPALAMERDARRGRRDGGGRPDEPARPAAQPARPRPAGAQVRPRGPRAAAQRRRAAAAAGPAGPVGADAAPDDDERILGRARTSREISGLSPPARMRSRA